MSLRLRIDLLFGLLLVLGLAADIGRMTVDARARAQAEGEAMTRVTRDFVETALVTLQTAADPRQELQRLAQSLDALRHVRVAFAQDFEPAAAFLADPGRRRAPDWFFALVQARDSVAVLPVVLDGRALGEIVIAADPADEVNEVWEDVRSLALTGGAIGLAVLLGASLIIRRTLRPLQTCAAALGRLRDGDYSARADIAGSPEFLDLCAKTNALAEALQTLSAANQALIRRLMDVQEEERKTIAHELHDEIGPYLFALRANASLLQTGLKGADEGQQARIAAIRDQIEALQAQNRRIFRQLRPPALDELGLCEALKILVEGWRDAEPPVEVRLRLPDSLSLDERRSLAIYRIAQEALTNIHRHARAAHATIDLEMAPAPPEIRLRIQDDGVGVDPAQPAGLGLGGMRERVRGLGGRFSIGPAPGGGSVIDVAIP